jgi:uncharacterized protein (DUF1778 family)
MTSTGSGMSSETPAEAQQQSVVASGSADREGKRVGDMAKDTSPVCFRLPPDERRMLEAVAAYAGQSVSDFIRRTVVAGAVSILDENGIDKIMQALDEQNEQKRRALQQAQEQAARAR